MIQALATIAILAVALYVVSRALSSLVRRLLWRVRRKLLLSYVFIGFIPALLIVVFFLLGGLLLFSTFGSYMLQARLRGLTDEAAALASATVVEVERISGSDIARVLDRRAEEAAALHPGASLAIVPISGPCSGTSRVASGTEGQGPILPAIVSNTVVDRARHAGAWQHADAPSTIPAWVSCGGFRGLLAYGDAAAVGEGSAGERPTLGLVARAVSFAAAADPRERQTREPRYAVIVDLPVSGPLIERFWQETGVELSSVRGIGSPVPVLPGRSPEPPTMGPRGAAPVSSLMFPEIVDWTDGSMRSTSVLAALRLSVGQMYGRMSAAQGAGGSPSIGQGLLFVLVAVGVLFLIIEGVALAVGFALARSITGSVHELFIGTERVRRGDFSHKIGVRARDQLGALATSFNSMTDSIETLLVEQAEKKRLEEELRIAHEIQMSLLPQGALDRPGLGVTAISVPAREVGGDYYDLFSLDADRVGVLVADVSGKGTSAALYMAELKGLMLSLSRIHSSPRDLLVAANRAITGHLDARSFITMTYAVIDVRARTLTYARAGHTPLLYVPADASDRNIRTLAPEGLALGLHTGDDRIFEALLREETITIHTNDLLALFTDGVSEAMDAGNDCYGEARLARLLERHADLSGEALRERVLADVASFVGGTPQHDDMTLLLVRVGAPIAPEPGTAASGEADVAAAAATWSRA